MRNLSLFALTILGLVACRDSGGGDDTQTPDGNTNPSDVTIQEIQNDAMPACDPANPATCVELKIKGVVVTAIDNFGGRTGDFWVQEPGGGPYSGVQVYGAPLDQVAALQIGDVVDIAGAQKAEFALSSDTSGNKLTELEPVEGGTMSVTKTGANMPVQPQAVDALAIGQMTDFMARHAEWEKWEGVLIKIDNPEAFSNTSCITSMGNCNDPTYERFDITGDIQVQSSLAAMPSTKVARGDCLGSVTGVIGYFFDYQILPRATAEIGTGGSSCPLENTDATCGDGLDNNGNGFKDCMDFTCQTSVQACVSAPMISAIQMGTATGYVRLENVYVTSLSSNRRHLWVQQTLTSGANEAVYVYRGSSASQLDAAQYAPGTKVTVEGLVQENNNDNMGSTNTQIGGTVMLTRVADAAGAPSAVTNQTAAALMAETTGEPYESVLITLTNVKVTALGTSTNFGVGSLVQGATTFKTDDDIYRLGANSDGAMVNTCYASITGIWTYLVFENAYGFLPLAVGTGTGTCQ